MPDNIVWTDEFTTDYFASGRYENGSGLFSGPRPGWQIADGQFQIAAVTFNHGLFYALEWMDPSIPLPSGCTAARAWVDIVDTDDAGFITVGFGHPEVHNSVKRMMLPNPFAPGVVGTIIGSSPPTLKCGGRTVFGSGIGVVTVDRAPLTAGRFQVEMRSDGTLTATTPTDTVTTTLSDYFENMVGELPYVSLATQLDSGSPHGHITLERWGYEYDFAPSSQSTINVGLAYSGQLKVGENA